MIRPLWFPLALAVLLTACSPSSPSEKSKHEEAAAPEKAQDAGEEAAPQQTKISAKAAKDAGIVVAQVGPGVIADEHEVQGLLTPVEGHVAQVTARFPGPIRSLKAGVGDNVKVGQALATIDSNLSLTSYTVSAPIAGVVMARPASIGMAATEGTTLFEIADLSTLWVDLHIFGADAGHISAGAPVTVTRLSDGAKVQATLERVLPGIATASQSTIARAAIHNTDGSWRPGAAVKARVTVDRASVDLAIPAAALQATNGQDVVYVQVGEIYSMRPVKVGRRDAERVEILSGLKAGELVVTEQSFLVKADIEKSTVKDED